jgi:hypothetical protein
VSNLLDELTNLYDDLDVADTQADESPEAIASATPSIGPIPSGKYGVKILSLDVDRDKDGNVRNKLLYVLDFEVLTPDKFAGRKVRFIRVNAKSQTRKTKSGDVKFTELFDLVHAFDPEFKVNSSVERAVRFLLERIQDNALAHIQIDWKAWDSKYFELMNGPTLTDGSEEKKNLAKACSFRGMKKFALDGTVLNPLSGNTLKANAYMKFAYMPKPEAQ